MRPAFSFTGPILLRSRIPSMRYVLLCLFLVTCFAGRAQAPKREFRAAWIATIGNIDWPLKQGLPAEEQRQSFIRRLDQMKRLGLNAAIVQIRPAADAFYPSTIEPWSRYLTGKQGVPPQPMYDPLEFMVEEAHKRNMEFHAWFNPFRALVDSKKNPNPPGHVTRLHPDWIISYGGKSYINPGIPEAREYVTDVIVDVVKRYDIDAVHLDDYFYPYRIAGVAFNDAASFAKYNPGNIADRDDWRRNNVNVFIQNLNARIKVQKRHMKLGISPFGVWRNASKDTAGSVTRGGQTNYDDLYADVRLWMQKGWIDYLLPQLYWEHGHRLVAYETLMPWWRDHAYGRQVYFGLGLYRMLGSPGGAYASTREILSQIADARRLAPGTGYALYSLSNLDKIIAPIQDSLASYGRTIALVPQMKWLDSVAPPAPVIKGSKTATGFFLQWPAPQYSSGQEWRYAVYRFRKGERIDLNNAERMLALTPDLHYLDAGSHEQSVYVVTALDRLWNESAGSNKVATE